MFTVTIVVRWVLTAALVFGVYTETGLFTAFFAAFVAVGMELLAAQLRGGE